MEQREDVLKQIQQQIATLRDYANNGPRGAHGRELPQDARTVISMFNKLFSLLDSFELRSARARIDDIKRDFQLGQISGYSGKLLNLQKEADKNKACCSNAQMNLSSRIGTITNSCV